MNVEHLLNISSIDGIRGVPMGIFRKCGTMFRIVLVVVALAAILTDSVGATIPAAGNTGLAWPFFSVDRHPPVPTPNAPVEILVNATSDESWRFELSFAVLGKNWTNVTPLKVYQGTSWTIFRGEIPIYPLGTNVTYFVSAFNVLGQKTSTPLEKYMVVQGSDPSVLLSFLERLPGKEIVVSVKVTDQNSPINRVTARYSLGVTPETVEFNLPNGVPLPLAKVAGSEYDASFLAFIPSQPSSTWVIVYVLAEDVAGKEGNGQISVLLTYPFRGHNSFLMYVRVVDLLLDENPPRASFEYEIYMKYGTTSIPDLPSFIPVWIDTGGSPLYYEVAAEKEPGSYYSKGMSEAPLRGDKAGFPLDSYTLQLNVTTAYFDYPEINVEAHDIGEKIWPYWNQQDHNTTNQNQCTGHEWNLCLLFVRKTHIQATILLPLIFGFLMAVATWSLKNDENSLRNRLTVYLAIFVFCFAFLSNIRDIIPKQTLELTIAEQVDYGLMIFTGVSTIVALLIEAYRTRNNGVKTDKAHNPRYIT
jgi:hypothetical protein